ncbi:MAG: DUF1801 domain-containing protein [Rubricoccaceae bacterium]|nr:DUF1801 domain-containing protein [Rubricoccaceae bacterium]
MASSDTRFGSFDDLAATVAPAIESVMRRLRAVVHDVHPGTVEVGRMGEQTVAFGLGPKKMSEAYAYVQPHAGHVNLGFYHGASLDDPDGLLKGTGKALRHVRVRTVEEAERPAVRRLIEAALAERRAALSR